jgi:hypothetical protein
VTGPAALTGSAAQALPEEKPVVADTRTCEQCGTSFAPRREHARFCSPPCRAAWNRAHTSDLDAGTSALQWSITAMNDTTERLSQATAWDRPRALAVIGEAVWWVTIVDATLVRHHQDAYDGVMASQAPAERQLTEETLAGLRFIRNRIGGEADLTEFIEPGEPGEPGPDPGDGHITGWTWKPVPEPKRTPHALHGQAWQMTRYEAYQTQLAGHTIAETFTRAAAFLKRAATDAPARPNASTHASH